MMKAGLMALLLLPAWAFASTTQPKVGLVLGGGGARGAAHVGVLKTLEEMRVPVHAITGTSVGAIIGGLYAMGKSADEIEALLLDIDWEDTFNDNPSRPNLSFRRKQDDLEFLIDFDLGFDGEQFLLPKGLVQGQKLNQIFFQWTLAAQGIDDFDLLPIPFKAIATDIVNGDAITIDQGDLMTAMRASMSVPAAFAPVSYGEHLLVDGGISNNVPADIMRKMGVDILIVVDVSFPLLKKEQLKSALDISNQVTTVFVKKTVKQARLNAGDIVILPELGLFSSADFPNIKKIIPLGAQAAEQQSKKLAMLSLSAEHYARYTAQRRRLLRGSPPTVGFINIENNSPISSALIKSRIRSKTGEKLDAGRLSKDISEIYGLGLFENVSARTLTKDEQTGVLIKTHPKSWGPNYVNFGLALADDFDGGSAFNIATRLTMTELNSMAAEWRNDLQFGDSPKFQSEWYQPVGDKMAYFIAPSVRFEESSLNTFTNNQRVAESRLVTRLASVALGREFSPWGEIRFGVERGSGDLNLRTGDANHLPVAEQRFDIGNAFMQIRYDRLDNVSFPTKGSRLEMDVQWSRASLQASETFDRYRLSWIKASSRGRHTALYRFSAGAVTDDKTGTDTPASVHNLFTLGGFLNISGISQGEKAGRYFAVADIVYYRRFGSMTDLFGVPVYAGVSLEAGNVWQDRHEIDQQGVLFSGSAFVGVDTFLGPVYLAAGRTEEGRSAFHFSLGRLF